MDEDLGLRERKKRRTRQAISDVATGLFIERGFDNVTVAEVAEAADVSVNTVFNYFRTKEDLMLDRHDEIIHRFSHAVRERKPGESAVAAVRRQQLDWLASGDYRGGLHEGAATFARVVNDSPALWSRVVQMLAETEESLARTLADEAGEDPYAITPRVVANQLVGVARTLRVVTTQRLSAGETVDEVRPDMVDAAKRAFTLLESGIGDYCIKRA